MRDYGLRHLGYKPKTREDALRYTPDFGGAGKGVGAGQCVLNIPRTAEPPSYSPRADLSTELLENGEVTNPTESTKE